jgi:hypothetical protein
LLVRQFVDCFFVDRIVAGRVDNLAPFSLRAAHDDITLRKPVPILGEDSSAPHQQPVGRDKVQESKEAQAVD